MTQRTLADVLDPLRKVASQAGLRAGDDRIVGLINDAQERLLSEVDNIVGSIHRLKFCQYDRMIALPAYYQRIIKGSIDRAGAPVMDKWYEFMDYGPGHLDTGYGVNVLVDRGEAPVIRQSVSVPAVVRCYGYKDERVDGTPKKIRVMGYDENGIWVRSNTAGVWSDGVELPINGHSSINYAESTVLFSRVTQVVKPVTNGVVELYFYAPTQEVPLSFAARYEYWETNPSFRLYFAAGISPDATAQVHALCKVRFRPLLALTDKLIVSNLPALKKAMRALAQEEADKIQDAEANWALAARILKKEANDYYGSTRPAIDVSTGGAVHGSIANVL